MSGKCLAGTVGWSAGDLCTNVSVRPPMPHSSAVGELGGPKVQRTYVFSRGPSAFSSHAEELKSQPLGTSGSDPSFPVALFFNTWIPDPFGICSHVRCEL